MKIKFFNAVKKGNLNRVKLLLSEAPSLIHEKQKKLSPVMTAAYYQHPEVADFLAEKIINLTIFEAAALGKINQVIRQLARHPEMVNVYSDDGFQPLGLACFFGRFETAEYLIKAGAPINTQSKNKLKATPLNSAAAGKHLQIVELLLNNGADPNACEKNGFTPLHAAAQNGDPRMISLLLFNGADMTISGADGKKPIDLANEAGHSSAAALLKEGITRRFRTNRPRAS